MRREHIMTVDGSGTVDIPRQGASVRMGPGELGTFDANRHNWQDIQSDAVDLGGADLLDADVIDYLVKVPHTIVKVAFYQGKALENGHSGAFVSATAMIAPEEILAKRFRGNDKVSDYHGLPFYGGDIVVYNDGSTGMYRQIVKALHNNGFIALPDPVIEGGEGGNSTYDLHPSQWTGIDGQRARALPLKDNNAWGGVEFDIRISAPRGIRYSEYDGPTGPARTRYIA